MCATAQDQLQRTTGAVGAWLSAMVPAVAFAVQRASIYCLIPEGGEGNGTLMAACMTLLQLILEVETWRHGMYRDG